MKNLIGFIRTEGYPRPFLMEVETAIPSEKVSHTHTDGNSPVDALRSGTCYYDEHAGLFLSLDVMTSSCLLLGATLLSRPLPPNSAPPKRQIDTVFFSFIVGTRERKKNFSSSLPLYRVDQVVVAPHFGC